jgi:hypothetical protein
MAGKRGQDYVEGWLAQFFVFLGRAYCVAPIKQACSPPPLLHRDEDWEHCEILAEHDLDIACSKWQDLDDDPRTVPSDSNEARANPYVLQVVEKSRRSLKGGIQQQPTPAKNRSILNSESDL